MNIEEQKTKLRADIDGLSKRITETQHTVGDGLSLLTRCLREKEQKLNELEGLLNVQWGTINNWSQGLLNASKTGAEVVLPQIKTPLAPGMVEPDVTNTKP